MAVRKKESRTCTYAYRNKETKILTEFQLIGYNGEGDDFIAVMKPFIAAAETLVLEDAQKHCATLLRESGFICDSVKITFVDEKVEETKAE